MFNFFNEFTLSKELKGYRYVNINGKQVYVQGFKNLLLISDEKIILKVDDKEIEILGTNLNIQELGNKVILINGNICGVNEYWLT